MHTWVAKEPLHFCNAYEFLISTFYSISRVYIFESFLPLQIEILRHFFAWICAELLWYENDGDKFQITNQLKSCYWNEVTSNHRMKGKEKGFTDLCPTFGSLSSRYRHYFYGVLSSAFGVFNDSNLLFFLSRVLISFPP